MLFATWTEMGPLVAAAGTAPTICVSLQLLTVSGWPYTSAMLLLCAAPKPAPLIVNVAPTGPAAGEKPVTESASITVNCWLLLVTPLTVTVTGPLVAVFGTTAVM